MTQDSEAQQNPARTSEWIEDVQRDQLDRLLEWIRAVDAKVPVLTAISCTMIAAVAAVAPPAKDLTWTAVALMVAGSAAPAVSLIFSALATFPQTKGPAGSLIYFGEIAKRSLEEYRGCIGKHGRAEHVSDLTAQCHRNAQIATSKYHRVQRSTAWLFVGIVPWLTAIYFLFRT